MIHQSAYILQPKQKKKKVEKKEKKEMKKEVKKEVQKEEKSSSSTKGPGGEHMFQVSTCIATDSLRLIRVKRERNISVAVVVMSTIGLIL